MHGLIHIILKDLVLSRFGRRAWEQILTLLGVGDDAALLEPRQHNDATTIACLAATTTALRIGWDDALTLYGAHFVAFLAAGGHLRLLESMGRDLKELLRNLNHMHHGLERKMRKAMFPCFRVSHEADQSFHVSYASVRGTALIALVEGALPAVADVLYGQVVRMLLLDKPEDGYEATWQVTVSMRSSKKDLPNSEVPSQPPVADPSGAARWGAFWHFAMSCCNSAAECSVEVHTGFQKVPKVVDVITEDVFINHELDTLAAEAYQADDPADVLMRAVPCRLVCSSWEDKEGMQRVGEFWGTNIGDKRHYNWALPAKGATCFISHPWLPPTNWHEVMGSSCSYAEIKGTELQMTAMEFAEVQGIEVDEVTLWIDKCCVPQKHSLMPFCISLIEVFLERCDGMIVILTWQYFERLWCVYEWAALFIHHHPTSITICLDLFFRPASSGLYLESIKNLSIDNCRCGHEPDRLVIKAKVAQYYYSEDKFEELARTSAIAMIARALCKGASRGQAAFEEEFVPFVLLAKELELQSLAEALQDARPGEWRSAAIRDMGAQGDAHSSLALEGKEWRPHFHRYVDEWFVDRVVPILTEAKTSAVKQAFVQRTSSAAMASVARTRRPGSGPALTSRARGDG